MAREKKEPKETSKQIEAICESGIRLEMVNFYEAARSFTKTPEFAFYDNSVGSSTKGRVAKIWYTPSGVVLIQEGGFCKIMPLASVKDTIVL